MKKTPFYDVGKKAGAKIVELFGYYLPWEYAIGHEQEHLGTRQRVSLCDLDYMGEFSVEGPDALNFIQKVATNDYSKKAVGSIQYTAFCSHNGNMVDDGTIWHLGKSKYLIITGAEDDFEWLQSNAKGMDVTVRNITSEHTTLAIQGPKSPTVMRKLTDADLKSLPYYHFIEAKVAGVDCLLARMGYTGEFGYEVHFHPKHGEQMWKSIMDAGMDVQIVPCGQAALESLRQEAGYVLVGNEHNKNTNPLEAGLGFTVKFRKEYFNGKNSLQEIARKGIKRRIVSFSLPEGKIARTGDSIYFDGEKVGTITSGSYSPTFRKGTALGYVAVEHAIPGLTFDVEIDGKFSKAQMSLMPLYDPGDVLTKSTLAS